MAVDEECARLASGRVPLAFSPPGFRIPVHAPGRGEGYVTVAEVRAHILSLAKRDRLAHEALHLAVEFLKVRHEGRGLNVMPEIDAEIAMSKAIIEWQKEVERGLTDPGPDAADRQT